MQLNYGCSTELITPASTFGRYNDKILISTIYLSMACCIWYLVPSVEMNINSQNALKDTRVSVGR